MVVQPFLSAPPQVTEPSVVVDARLLLYSVADVSYLSRCDPCISLGTAHLLLNAGGKLVLIHQLTEFLEFATRRP